MKNRFLQKISNPHKLWIHLILWLIILQLIFDISGLYYSFRELFVENRSFVDEAFLLIPLFIFLFYMNSAYLIPSFFQKRTWWKYCLGLIASFLLCLYLGSAVFQLLVDKGYHFQLDRLDFEDTFIGLGLLTIGISSSLGMSKIAFRQSALQKEALQKQKEAELKFLNTQVNPHFLFNTLNSIYALATEEQALKTTEAVLKLSEIMRYPLKEGTQASVSLGKEVQFLKNYIDLQKLRLGEDYPIHVEITGNTDEVEIAPLLLIPFIENSFKYGVSQSQAQPIYIRLACEGRFLHFSCKNTLVKPTHTRSHKLGIDNVRERLALIYGDKYELSVQEQDHKFEVVAKIPV